MPAQVEPHARVSVIVPCYDLGAYLEEALASIAAQTYDDIEVIVVDDGSTDPGTRDVLDRCAGGAVRVVRAPHGGLPAAKNVGLAHSHGEYVCMLDADDRAHPRLIERSVAVLDAEPELAFVSHWLQTFGDEHVTWTPDDCGFPALLDVNTVNGAALVRRSALEAVGGFDESFSDGCEDWDVWIALVAKGLTGRILPEVLFDYRRRADSMSRRMAKDGLHPTLYRRLADKHAAVFARHLPALLRRRERDLASLRLEVHRLELDHHDVVAPDRQSSRDDAAARARSQARRAEQQAQEAAEQHRSDLQAEVDRLRAAVVALEAERTAAAAAAARQLATDHDEAVAETGRLEQALAAAGAEARRLERALDDTMTEARRLDGEVAALRSSWSWQITSPLRAVHERLWRRGGPA